MTKVYNEETCKACSGTGVQYNYNSGLRVLCPVCNGKGKRHIRKEYLPSIYHL